MSTIIFSLLLSSIRQNFRTRVAMQAEVFALRHQLLVLHRANKGRSPRLSLADRLLWVGLLRLWSGWRSALVIVKREKVIAWHRKGFRLYWQWKSRHPQGRPSVSPEVIALIRKMSLGQPSLGCASHSWRALEGRLCAVASHSR
jgi:putative transposase